MLGEDGRLQARGVWSHRSQGSRPSLAALGKNQPAKTVALHFRLQVIKLCCLTTLGWQCYGGSRMVTSLFQARTPRFSVSQVTQLGTGRAAAHPERNQEAPAVAP